MNQEKKPKGACGRRCKACNSFMFFMIKTKTEKTYLCKSCGAKDTLGSKKNYRKGA